MKVFSKKGLLLIISLLCMATNIILAQEQVLINRTSPINSTEILGLSRQLSSAPLASKFGGMYIETTGTILGRPYYGYALDGNSMAYHYYDGADHGWHLFNGGIAMSVWADSVKWVTTSGDEIMFDGHRLQVGKNGNTYIGQGVTPTDHPDNIANTIVGWLSGRMLTSGVSNTIYGFRNSENLNTGDFNTVVGSQAADKLQDGSQNTYIGFRAGWNGGPSNTGNVFIGHKAGEGQDVNNKLIISNSETTAPLIEGDFDTESLNINGSLYLPNIPGSELSSYNLRISNSGRVFAEGERIKLYSGDFNDWYSNGLPYTRAISLNKFLRNGMTLTTLSVWAKRFVSTSPDLNLTILRRVLATCLYAPLVEINATNLPATSVESILETINISIDLRRFEYLLVTDGPATNIIKVEIF